MVKIYKQPFAHDGDTIAIPDASQPDGKMSSADGWTPDYQLPKTDPNYKPVGRQEMNGVFKEVTKALGEVQVQGAATWSADGAPYPVNAQVYHDGKQWLALRANSVAPVEGADWRELLFGNLVPASETILGLVELATAGEAQALTADDVVLTPKKLSDAFKGANQSLSSPGRQKFPGGLIIQSFSLSNTNNAGAGFSISPLPVSFPNGVIGLTASVRTTSPAYIPYHVSVVDPGIGTISWVVYDMDGTPISTPGTVTTDFIILGH